MATMDDGTKVTKPLIKFRNQLEPNSLLDAFFAHPPHDFLTEILPNQVPVFSTIFDLTTTMDRDDRKRITSLPFYRLWSFFLRYKTLFVGTTVSEFAPIPFHLDGLSAAKQLIQKTQNGFSLIIVKDLPQISPLVDKLDSKVSQSFLDELTQQGFMTVDGQALAYVPVNYQSVDDYLARFSKTRRKDFRRKLRKQSELVIEVLKHADPLFYNDDALEQFYALYLQVYQQSEMHFDLLSKEFFCQLLQNSDESLHLITYRNLDNQLIGYNICFHYNDLLIDKYIGFDYPSATDYNLYFISWFFNLEYARKLGVKFYVAGWTDPEIKAYLGASFSFTRHAVYVKNPILRAILKRYQHHFESDKHIFQESLGMSDQHE